MTLGITTEVQKGTLLGHDAKAVIIHGHFMYWTCNSHFAMVRHAIEFRRKRLWYTVLINIVATI